jgi:hypothetical protein
MVYTKTSPLIKQRLMLPLLALMAFVVMAAYTCNVSQSRESGHRWGTVYYCIGTIPVPVGCFPYPLEWGSWFVVSGHLHGNDNNPTNDYWYHAHYGEQVLWFNDVRDNNGNYYLPFGLLYGMSNEVHSYSDGDLGNIPMNDPCPPLLIPGDFAVYGCFDSASDPINLGKPGGYGEFHVGWTGTGTVLWTSGNTWDVPWFMYHNT